RLVSDMTLGHPPFPPIHLSFSRSRVRAFLRPRPPRRKPARRRTRAANERKKRATARTRERATAKKRANASRLDFGDLDWLPRASTKDLLNHPVFVFADRVRLGDDHRVANFTAVVRIVGFEVAGAAQRAAV